MPSITDRAIPVAPTKSTVTERKDVLMTPVLDGDYAALTEQLRSAGYDEDLTRQILLATLNRDHLLSQGDTPPSDYWKKEDIDRTAKVNAEIRWQGEKRSTLLRLFGNAIVDDPLFEDLFKPMNKTLPFLSSEKQISLHDIQLIEQADARELFQGGFTEEARQDRQAMRQSTDEKIRLLLSPDEYFEYQVRDSRLSQRMRSGMDAFDYSEQEFRDIFKLRQQNEGTDASFVDRATYREQRNISEQQIKDYLGTNRYEAYARSQDPAFRSLQTIGDRYGNSSDDIIKVYKLTQQTEQDINSIRSQQGVTREARIAQIQTVRKDTFKKIEDIVGEDTAASIQANARQLGFGRRRPIP